MLHDPKTFGRRHIGWELRARIERRRSARRASIAFALVAAAAGAGAVVCGYFGNVGGAAVLGIAAFGALIIGTAAATEA